MCSDIHTYIQDVTYATGKNTSSVINSSCDYLYPFCLPEGATYISDETFEFEVSFVPYPVRKLNIKVPNGTKQIPKRKGKLYVITHKANS